MTRSISIDFLIGLAIGLILAGLWLQRKAGGDDGNLHLLPRKLRAS